MKLAKVVRLLDFKWRKEPRRELHVCRVCGFFTPDYFPWGETGTSATFDFCACCGVEFGYEDFTVRGCRVTRKKWFERGTPWFEPEFRPDDWDPQTQLDQIPQRFR